jgi:hypothetical protein
MVAWRARWWTLGGRTRSMAMRVSKARSRDNGVGIVLIPAATIAGTIQWPLLMSAPVGVVQDVLLGWRHVRSKAPRGDGVPIQHFLQDAFLDMWETVARAVGDLDSVLGFEVCCQTSC